MASLAGLQLIILPTPSLGPFIEWLIWSVGLERCAGQDSVTTPTSRIACSSIHWAAGPDRVRGSLVRLPSDIRRVYFQHFQILSRVRCGPSPLAIQCIMDGASNQATVPLPSDFIHSSRPHPVQAARGAADLTTRDMYRLKLAVMQTFSPARNTFCSRSVGDFNRVPCR